MASLRGKGLSVRQPGYPRWKVWSSPSFRALVHVWSSKCTPFLLYCICCFFTIRLLTTWFTADSTKLELYNPLNGESRAERGATSRLK